jgi:squalene-hopene/tetraprenyl-beta-curcumene cyclase
MLSDTTAELFADDRLALALSRAANHLFSLQHTDGYWRAELEANSTLTSEYVFLTHILGRVTPTREAKCIDELLARQLADGGWGINDHKGGELSTSIEAYAALKMSGVDPQSAPLQRGREFIRQNGGLEGARTFTKIYLALLGLGSYRDVPAIPPWVLLFPDRFPLSIYQMSSWARSCVVPLIVLLDKQPIWRPQRTVVLDELLRGRRWVNNLAAGGGVETIFLWVDRALHWLAGADIIPFRTAALGRAERWILEHQDDEGDWGGIMPAMAYSILALRALGYPDAHPVLRRGWQAIERFGIETSDRYRMQSCVSPVWDTALAIWSLREAEVSADHLSILRGARWLLDKQGHHYGDWRIKNGQGRPGAWSFEFFNRFYPDCDDTSACILALRDVALGTDTPWRDVSIDVARQWVLSMQSKDGGWGAFDMDNTQTLWNEIPFADHKAMLDTSSPDLTGRVLEMLGCCGFNRHSPAIERALRYLQREQRANGSWYGRWGVNFVYGTWAVLSGAHEIGLQKSAPLVQRGTAFLMSVQNEDGGWGESTESYDVNRFVPRASTPSQTAWGVMGLLAGGQVESRSVRRGVAWLVAHQRKDGGWDEDAFTGTGFPRHFYIRYHLYRDCFPMMALARYRKHGGRHG